MPIRPPWFLRKRNPGPEFCRVRCTSCDFDKEYELTGNYIVINNPEDDAGSDEIAGEFPEVCPKCGAKLKKEKLPVTIRY